jgi:ethanolamine utilization cobalamin adenosyltransferase
VSKILINEKNLDQFIKKDEKSIVVDKTVILSPSAKDILKERGIKVIYENSTYKKENRDMMETIINVLKRDFNLKDVNLINEIAIKVLKMMESSNK